MYKYRIGLILYSGNSRLVGGGENWGLLQVAHAGQFGSVCGARKEVDFSNRAATVACRNMGFQVNLSSVSSESNPAERVWLVRLFSLDIVCILQNAWAKCLMVTYAYSISFNNPDEFSRQSKFQNKSGFF